MTREQKEMIMHAQSEVLRLYYSLSDEGRRNEAARADTIIRKLYDLMHIDDMEE